MTEDGEAPQNHVPSLDTVNAAYNEVLDYNNRHTGWGVGIGKMMKSMIQAQIENPEGSEDEVSASAAKKEEEATTEGDMHGELQKIIHEDTFMRIGIKLSPLGSYLGDTEGQRKGSAELLPIVENVELYTEFLSSLDPQEVQKDEKSIALFSDTISTLRQIVAVCYGEKPEVISNEEHKALMQYGEDALRTFLKIDDVYKKIGLDNPELFKSYLEAEQSGYSDEAWKRRDQAEKYLNNYKGLENYVNYWGRGVLPEYIATGSMESLAEDKRPYLDGMHDKLVKKVDDIVDLTKSERTRGFGVEAAQAMLTGLRETVKQMDEQPEEWFTNDENRNLFNSLEAKLLQAIG
jgi:hypothetical protein